jgi:hypothetical protein
MPAERGHLLAHDDLEAEAAIPRDRLGRERGVDPLMVGDGDDVELGLLFDVVEDVLDARGAVARERVDVQVGAAAAVERRAHAAAPVESSEPFAGAGISTSRAGGASGAASPSRSGQSGKKTAHHWSGASAMRSSNAAANRFIVVVTRSRRVPSVGTSIGITRPR